ncbi:hypothetical protein HOU08_gp063 [Dickeya phage vB_DsoM_JA29]|uniref:Uncharacterized protein n=1 Tax=Dickeya phage vB_DsoM_JA29 TaxID=2283031 RepID=A0A384ZX36_9CAUD|nr:hypothetical protein HOU08_gp063 [Dickeya phage vB_DsoM_JA29]AXG66789.1 hypothetical protein JA29_063 [Dickeya phage vB_DsoM_JA29]
MFQRFGIDQHTTLQRMKKRARRNALFVLSQGKKECALSAYIYSHEIEANTFALAFEEIKPQTLNSILLIEAEVLNFVRKNDRVFEIVDGVEIQMGKFNPKVSRFLGCKDLPPNNVVSLEKTNGRKIEADIG